jgi:hypothetical protein
MYKSSIIILLKNVSASGSATFLYPYPFDKRLDVLHSQSGQEVNRKLSTTIGESNPDSLVVQSALQEVHK